MTASPLPRNPDVVFFMVDQLAARWLEAARAGVLPTPNFDRLAARGTTFSRFITSNPVCCPARSTLATGLTSRGHGLIENGYQLDPSLPTFMRTLQAAGWRTGAFGKVHFIPHYASLAPDYRPYGFDVVHNTEDPRAGEWLDWVRDEHPEHYEAVLATIWCDYLPGFASYGPGKINLAPRIVEARTKMTWATKEFPQNTPGHYTLPFPEEISQTAWITARALDFIRDTPPDTPLYAHVSYVQPHSPFSPPAEYMARVNVADIPAPVPAEWADDPNAPGYYKRHGRPDIGNWQYARQCYFADIAHLDSQLGKLLDALEAAGRLDNAYVVFLADHGELLGDHGFYGKEERHYDACIRVPLMIAGPGLRAGETCGEMVEMTDLCPTVLEAAGAAFPPMPKLGKYLNVPAEAIPQFHGRSLLGLCRGDSSDPWREGAYCESYNVIWSLDPCDWARTIRTKDYRYTWYPRGGGQLFQVADDPDEQRNLVADPAHAAALQRLRDELMEMIVLQDYPKTRRELFALGVH